MMELIFWAISVIISLFLVRQCIKIFDEIASSIAVVVVLVIASFIPLVNIVFMLIVFIAVVVSSSELDRSQIVKKFFFIKEDK